MNQNDIVRKIVDKYNGFTLKEVNAIVDEFVDIIENAVSNGEKVMIHGFGTFERVERAARIGRNPKTGATVPIAPKKFPKFKPLKKFRDRMS